MSDAPKRISRAWYSATIDEFLASTPEAIIGILATNGQFSLMLEQKNAWLGQIDILRDCLSGLKGSILLEYSIPRMGSRIDTVLLIGPLVIAIEFKVGQRAVLRSSREQVWDYTLDLKNFHKGSHHAQIVPLLVATEVADTGPPRLIMDPDGVYKPIVTNSSQLREVIDAISSQAKGAALDQSTWLDSPYQPTPTIIEAARALYSSHSVESIARNDAGAKNLAITSKRIEELVDESYNNGRKIVCFVTGVPGAGKTLVGLNVATKRREGDHPTHAVFLSGNGPLVAVLREALALDEIERLRQEGTKKRKGQARSAVKAFIQNVHHFRDEGLIDDRPPDDHIAIFDEAQRAWDLDRTRSFMKQRKGYAGFNQSEPEFLFSYLDRHKDWAAIVCLVGGGQEINRGEAGIRIWLSALEERFQHWHAHISSRLVDSEYACTDYLQLGRRQDNVHFDDALHLGVSMRSFRAENVSHFVKALLDREEEIARASLSELVGKYPIAVTRDLEGAKNWIRTKARGSERFGMMASSAAQRLKPHAIDVRVNVDPVHWFLNGKDDTRSSYYLEDAATEFQVQGLEVDWGLVTWDADLRYSDDGWSFHDFRGSQWYNIRKEDRRRYLLNAYRVLLTRARQGMVIFIPEGDSTDPTRVPEYYDRTCHYLADLGIPRLS